MLNHSTSPPFRLLQGDLLVLPRPVSDTVSVGGREQVEDGAVDWL